MVHDRRFYDVARGEYTVDAYLDDLEERFGGIDLVLMWYPYPNLGVDERSQLGMLSSMPGGLDGVRRAVESFHARGVKVLIPFLPWDTGGEAGAATPAALAEAIAKIDADGFNGDTMTGIPLEYFSNVSAALGRPAVLQVRTLLASRRISSHLVASRRISSHLPASHDLLTPPPRFLDIWQPEDGMEGASGLLWTANSWSYGFQQDFSETSHMPLPSISWYRQVEPRHVPMVCNRWATNHTGDILSAYD